MNHSTAKHTFARRYGRGFWRRKFSESAKPNLAALAAGEATGADSGLDSEVAEQAVGDTRSRGTDTKGTVARCVGGTDSPHVASLSGGETAGAHAWQHQQRWIYEVDTNQQASPPSRHSAGGGVCCVIPLLAAQVHADRWATLAVITVFICAFAVAAYRANRSGK